MKRTIEIEDCLQERVDDAIAQVEAELLEYLAENKPETCPDWGDLDYSGVLHEIIDGAVPIYSATIEATWYFYGNELEQAYEAAGIGKNPRENYGMAAIFCYIEQKAQEWFHRNAKRIFADLQAPRL